MIRTILVTAIASLFACGHVATTGDDGGGPGDDGGGGGPTTIEVSPTSIDFGQVSIVETPLTQTLTITNTGGNAASPSFAFSGTDAASFQIGAVTCGAELAPGDHCTIEIALAVTHDGDYQASIDVSAGGSQASAGIAAVSLAVKLSMSPTGDNFGDVGLGTTSTHHYTLSNDGDAPLPLPTLQITGAGAYTIDATNCPAMLAAAESCVFDVTFHSSALGTQTATTIASIGPLSAGCGLTARGTAQLGATKAGSGGGTVTGGGLACGPPAGCTVTVASSPILVTATPASGSVFSSWGGAAASCGANPSCNVAITTGSVNVIASFADLPTLTVDINNGGGASGSVAIDDPPMSCTNSCTNDYPAATVVHLTPHFDKNNCEQFDGWSGACFGQSDTCTLTVNGNLEASAGFSIDPTCIIP